MDDAEQIVHSWNSTFLPGVATRLDKTDGTLLRTIQTVTAPTGLQGAGGGLQRLALDGTLLWDFRYDGPGFLAHHDIAPLPNGNVIMMVWDDRTSAEAIAAGRDPALLSEPIFRPDYLIEVQQTGPTTGQIVWEWHMWDHLVQDFDSSKANFGNVANSPDRLDINYPPEITLAGDWNHFNGIDYDAVNDVLVVSSREQDEIYIIDHSTTTAQAATGSGGNYGKGGRILYRWGNDQAYDRGTAAAQQLFGQHAPTFVPPGFPGEGNIVIFNNQSPPLTSVVEIVVPRASNGDFILGPGGRYGPANPVWTYSNFGFGSGFVSSAERLPNGNTLVCSGSQGWIFEVTPQNTVAWQYFTGARLVFHAHHTERSMWVDGKELSLSTGDTRRMDIIAGSDFAGSVYFMMASGSGSTPGIQLGQTGVTLPLNLDGLFDASIVNANLYPWANSFGLLDANGCSNGSFSLPGGILPPVLAGLEISHAAIIANPADGSLRSVTNAVTFTLTN